MPKMMRALAALLVASFILAACGGETATPTATSGPAAPAATNTTMMAAATSTTAMTMDMTPTMGSDMMMSPTMGSDMMMTPAMTSTMMPGMDMTPMMTGTMMMDEATPTTAAATTDATPAPTATAIPPQASNPNAKFSIVMWTKEGEPTLSWINNAARTFSQKNPDYNIVVINKGVEDIKGQLPQALLAANEDTPDLLWTVSDHIGVFAPGENIATLDDVFGADYNSKFIGAASEAAKFNGKSWAVPLSAGNHLMLMYNKKLVSKVPETWSELITTAKTLTSGDGGTNAKYGLVWNYTEPFWLNPFLAGFGSWPLSNPDNAQTAAGTLDTPEMVKTLQFISDLKNKEKIMPAEADYNTADQLFKDGRAAMLINGDWSISGYLTDTVKDKLELGIAPMPKIDATGLYPAPMVAGTYLMVPARTLDNQDKIAGIKLWADYLTSKDVQLDFSKTQNRLPALAEAGKDAAITGDPIQAGSIAQLEKGKPQPVVPQMRCVFDAEKTPLQDVLSGKTTPEKAAKDMQTSYDTCAKDINVSGQ